MRRFLCSACLFLFVVSGAFSQVHITVPLDDPVYHLLEIAYIRGALAQLSAVRPYTQSSVVEKLQFIRRNDMFFSGEEQEILGSVFDRYVPEPNPFAFDLGLDSDIRTDSKDAADYHLYSAYNFVFTGDITEQLSYRFFVAPTLDRVNSEAFAPFSFTNRWDFNHVSTKTGEHLKGDFDELAVGQAYYPELALTAFDERVLLNLSKVRRNWGVGHSSLQLSGTANPFEAIEASMHIAPWLRYSFLTGSLGDYTNKKTSQSMISTKRVEFFITEWFYLAFYDSVIWGKRLELNYLNPFSVAVLAQGVTGDLDNIFTGGTFSFRFSPYGLFYFSGFLDDYKIEDFKPFENPLWKFALYGGVKVPVPYLPFTLLTFQYTKVEPWMYTHYPQEYPFHTRAMNVSYVHSGENLGYYLPPNSDEFLFELKSMPLHNLAAMFKYQYIRHGDGDMAAGQVEGDITKSQRFDIPGFSLDDIPRKDFLNDGIYEFIHILTLDADYELDLEILALRFGPQYSFVSAKNFENIEGNDVVKHIIGFSLKGSFNAFTYGK